MTKKELTERTGLKGEDGVIARYFLSKVRSKADVHFLKYLIDYTACYGGGKAQQLIDTLIEITQAKQGA